MSDESDIDDVSFAIKNGYGEPVDVLSKTRRKDEILRSQAARIAELEAALRNLIDRYDEVVTTPDCSCSRDDHDVMVARAALAVKP